MTAHPLLPAGSVGRTGIPATSFALGRRTAAGRLVIDHLPMLAAHRGTPPDLILRWGAIPAAGPTIVDVVVHLHGYSARGAAMRLPRDIESISGLDLTDPDHPDLDRPRTDGRSTPTLMILPRGDFFGGRSGRGYGFPALVRPGAIDTLVLDAIRRLQVVSEVHATRGRLILTAHSGGGQPLMSILRHVDPDEIHTFDALYTDPRPLIAWARRRRGHGFAAMRVLYRPGEGTAANSLRVAAALSPASLRFRVEQTRTPHMQIPRKYGWRLLADPASDLPGAGRPRRI